ncbi:2-polyprenyl-6-methoxyphenol hydroxylase-like FAD-dependent oxidoreductase [Nocardia transvalensis]|uniref:2-polyprenyl-6-methoxyphenol hydroxylase-like FAD-dependent oxidoreductase n=1 Tax=Nocardia transvalensis TaxID=37333 RepID=A0A7W9ULJ4_9NOCA|nr:FAD-dependent monooxygenase [Nocardia transvalensis]MBB5917628.1 2-polyprenyl-6-methoxyphenol hydroxylase-like FAD-dependent oxidoreductase [Nocardia transvalensis]
MKNQQILISGAGIAGQTLAYWLAAHGFRPTVVERAPGLRTGGQGVDIRDQAIVVAERMGIMDRARVVAADVAGMRFVRADGGEIARIDMDGIKNRYDSAEVEIMRGDLVRILHEITMDTVEYLFDDSIQALDQDDDGVTVTFANSPSRRFDLVIGADGLHSSVRRLAFGPESDFVRYMGHYFAFGNADATLGPDRWVTVHNTPGRMSGIYRSANHPQAKAYLVFRSRQRDIDLRDQQAARALLSEEFGTEKAWHVQELLSSVLADPDAYIDALGQVRMDSWSTGRIALVGDAAYCASPVSGAGAELALIGAYRLAGELATAAGDHRVAFDRYEQTHRPLIARKQQVGPNLRLIVPRSRLGMAVRNTITRLPLLESMAGMERIMSPKATEPLADYGAPQMSCASESSSEWTP